MDGWTDWGLLIGALLEGLGLGFVAVDISDRRSRYDPGRISLLQRLLLPLRWMAMKLGWRPKPHMGEAHGAFHAHSAGRVHFEVDYKFDGSLEDRVARLQEIVQQHERAIGQARRAVDDEEERRKAEDGRTLEAAKAEAESLRTDLRNVAAGQLSREAWGVFLFLLGLLLQTVSGVAS